MAVALNKPVRRSIIESLEGRELLTSNSLFGYLQVPLAADDGTAALLKDPNLQSAWGLAIAPGGGPLWVADNATNELSRFSGDVSEGAFTGMTSVAVANGSPTAIVANTFGGFDIGTGQNATTSLILTASLNGQIDGWSTGGQAQTAVNVGGGAEFTGLTIANNNTNTFLYAADFANAKIDVFDTNFNQTTLSANAFTDAHLPAGYAPYNIQAIGTQIFVTYAPQNASKQSPVAGPGNGIIDIYNLDGSFVKELVVNSDLNVPYGLAVAPAGFGDSQGDLLVANSGDGTIATYSLTGSTPGAFQGLLNLGPEAAGANPNPLTIPGIRALAFGNDTSAGNDTTLFYTSANGGHGQLGEILNAFDQQLAGAPAVISANQAQAFSGTVAVVSDSNVQLQASGLTVMINWGDNSSTQATLATNGNNGFNVTGSHTYASAGTKHVTIIATDTNVVKSISLTGTATVTDTSFSPISTAITATEGQSFSGLVGSFTDAQGPGNYVATIDWGDDVTSSATTIAAGTGGEFDVTGTHTYTTAGSFTVKVLVSEPITGTTPAAIGTIDSTAAVSDPNTLTPTGGNFSATEGVTTTTKVATFTDTNTSATATDFTATIDWGDGTTASAGQVTGSNGTFTVTATHAFAENGSLSPTVTITDKPTGTVTTSIAAVANVADGNTFTARALTIASNALQTFTGNVASFSDANSLVRAADFTATIDWGDSTTTAGSLTAANGVVTVSGTHEYASGGTSESVVVIINEKSGSANSTATSTALVGANDLTPTPATVAATASIASSLTLASFATTAGNSSDHFTATIEWGDGTSATAATVNSTGGSNFNVVGSHTYATPGNYAPQVIVFEASGTATPTPAEVITAKANVASPIVLTPQTITAKDHTSSSLTVATFSDAQASVTASDFTATIDWGDGTSASTGSVTLGSNGIFTVTGVHTFAEPGTLDVSVTLSQSTPTEFTTTAVATATVSQDDSFTVKTPPSLTATAGSAVSGTIATFNDTDTTTNASTGQLTAVIDWGDNTQSAGTVTGSGGVFAVSGAHTYAHDGAFTVKVTIENSSSVSLGFTETIATGTALVSPTTFTATASSITPTEGQTFSGTVATFTDAGSTHPASDFTATIDWGDGQSSTTVVSGSNGTYTVAGSHLYTDSGSFQVTVHIVETAISDTISAVSTATVSDNDTLTSSNMTITATAGTTFSGTVANFTDSNTSAAASDFTATISWGDGSTSTVGSITGSGGAFTVTGSHLYSTAATDVVKVTITDVDLTTKSATATSTADVLAATTSGATTGTISGMVFDDLSVSGVFQTGDTGLAGRTVFLNTDGSGTADGTNPQTTTDANGNFTFTGLASGSYQVMEVIPANDGQTLTSSVRTITLATGQTVTGVNIGNSITSTIVPVQIPTSLPAAGSNTNATYITALYQTILGHAPDATGLAFWEQQLTSGASQASVVQGIWNSTEHRKEEVDDFYEEFLGRAADAQGEQFWINAFSAWGTEQLEAVGFLTATSEYLNLHSGNTAFVDALYNNIDQRPADTTGQTNWLNQLGNGATPVEVALDFVFGQEAATNVVNDFYSAFLHRVPDAPSLQMWVGDLDAKTLTAEQVAIQLLSSTEYFSLVTGVQAPAITSATSTTMTVGTAGSFTITTSGVPTGAIGESGALPNGLTFTDNGNGTATIAGTPAAGTGGTYNLTLSYNNRVGTAATQSFVLTVDQAPVFTSNNSVNFTAGKVGTFNVTATGMPSATITESGNLPSGVTFSGGTGGTATISGTPAANSGAIYNITLTATNGIGTQTQNFSLIVNQAPSITSSNSATFVVGTAGTFNITSTGLPAATISESGTLPAGLTFTAGTGGTATISGTPAAGSANSYPITLTASNGVGTAFTQQFTLTVANTATPPVFSTTSNPSAFTVGTAGTFAIATTGAPSAALTKSGNLPAGVTFVDNGGGQGTLSGTPAAGTGGTYSFSITANNGDGSPVTQNYVLTVDQPLAFTSTNATTFVAGTAGTFKIQTSGFPIAAISSTTLPGGLTLNDNHDGTATLTSNTSLAANTYQFNLTATNGSGGQASQTFTLTVASSQTMPAFTSVASATFTTGTGSAFTVTTSGAPSATLTATVNGSGTLPQGITFVDNGGGQGEFVGTPAAGSAGTYSITITATNAKGTATQNFTLVVD